MGFLYVQASSTEGSKGACCVTEMTTAFAVGSHVSTWTPEGGGRILTQVSPVAHAREDDNALPEVTGHIAELANYEPRKEAKSLVEERDQE